MTTSKRLQETAKQAAIGQAVSALGSLLSTSQPVPIVSYLFECGDVEWHVRHVSVEETLGSPYRYTLQLVTDDTDILIEELVGANATLEIIRDDKIRYVKGYVEEIEHLGVVSHHTRIRVHVVPALAWLARTRSSRIFQEQTTPEIIKAIVEPVLSARGRSLDATPLDKRGFQPREYCVQFYESDLDFLHRLLEGEGLTYFFDQARETWETVVFR
jgi:type VI secretion system secreted protein VgrG